MLSKNAVCANAFESIKNQVETHDIHVRELIKAYERKVTQKKAESEKYRASREMLADALKEMVPETRRAILAENAELTDVLVRAAGELQNEFQSQLCHILPRAFLENIQAYNLTGIVPTRAELESLVTLADGHPIAQKMTDELAKKSGSGFRVDMRTISDRENDIDFLKAFATNLLCCVFVPEDCIASAAQIYGDITLDREPDQPENGIIRNGTQLAGREVLIPAERKLTLNARGELVSSEEATDFISVNSASVGYASGVQTILSLESCWTELKSFPDIVKSEDENLELARQLGQERSVGSKADLPKEVLK